MTSICMLIMKQAQSHMSCAQVWQEGARVTRSSTLQGEVSAVLSGMGIAHESEVLTPDGLFSRVSVLPEVHAASSS